jgi:hypothetical protein
MKTPRKGVSLIEALMAIFVTAIGLLSLLVLFPVGAFRMAQAITDDRSAHTASSAFALAQARNIHSDPALGTFPADVFTSPAGNTALTTAGLNYDGPSYPVYVDPIGSLTNTAFISSATGPGIPRSSVSFVTTPDPSLPTSAAAARYWFSLLDDLSFQTDTATPGEIVIPVTRDGTYTAAFMLRRPRFQISSIVETAVVVYKNRPAIQGGENAYQNIKFLDPALAPNEVQITWNPATQETPPIRKGSWILDATVLGPSPTTRLPPYNYPEPHGYFYRVVNVTDQGNGAMIIELQNAPKQKTVDNQTPTPGGYGVLVVMENVVEVFEKGPGWKP